MSAADCYPAAQQRQPEIDGPFLGGLFPSGVVTSELLGPVGSLPALPEESLLVRDAVSHRKLEFAAGRACARRALTILQAPTGPILRDEKRAPLWPSGIVGSISHTKNAVGAAAAWSGPIAGIGLDIEVLGGVSADLWPTILTEREQRVVLSAAESQQSLLSTLYFSAKEAVYKCQYTIAGAWLDFHDVEVDFRGGEFEAINVGRHKGFAWRRMAGRYRAENGLVATAAALHWP